MKKKSRTQHSPEFKAKVALEALRGDRTIQVRCPPITDPGLMLGLDRFDGGRYGQEEPFG